MKNKVKLEKIDEYFIFKMQNGDFFKLDCVMENYNLNDYFINAFIATVAGFSAIDIQGSNQIIKETKKAIIAANLILKNFSYPLYKNPLIFISEKITSLKFADNISLIFFSFSIVALVFSLQSNKYES